MIKNSKFSLFGLLCLVLLSVTVVNAFNNSTFALDGDSFSLNGKRFKIVGGQIHYSRIPVEYWRHRIQMVRALGCNTLSVYIMWNYHETSPNVFDFTTENKNLALFLQIAQEENMYVLIRPGPYICGEWDFGGLPYWLLQDPKMQLRSTYPGYVSSYQNYLQKVAEIIEPFQINYGGPIIMLQIENEYGYWGKDNTYPKALLNNWIQTGRIVVPFYTADGPDYIKIGGIDSAAIGLNPGITDQAWFQADREFPDVPHLSAETYPGWITHWGEQWATRSAAVVEEQLNFLCDTSDYKSFSIYMAFGGSNFGFTSGANFDLGNTGTFQPDVTSYDYDAPITENGDKTAKFNDMRYILSNCLSRKISAVPEPIPTMQIGEFKPTLYASLWENLPAPISNLHPQTFETLNQPHGFVLYSATITPNGNSERSVFIQQLHDYANVYTNGDFQVSMDRRLDEYITNIDGSTTKLDILVESMGHINFSLEMNNDRKGITSQVTVDDVEILNWNHYSIPLDTNYIKNLRSIYDPKKIKEGLFFRSVLTLTEAQDTFFDMSRWSKGYLWVNGRNLGRFWNIGPQFRLYCPGVWLQVGDNEIIVFDFHKIVPEYMSGATSLK